MRWQRVARMVLAAVGLGVAVLLYVNTRERPMPEAQPGGSLVADPQATVQAGKGAQIRYRDGDKQFTVEYTASSLYSDGRTVLEGARLTLEDGTIASADRVESQGSVVAGAMPEEFRLKGNARFQTPDGAIVQAGEATITDASGQAVMPGPVTFTRGRMSGTGTGGTYERDTGVFKLLADAHVTGAADSSGHTLDARSSTLTFNRAGKALLFDGQATLTTDTDVMTADRATLYLTDDHEQFRVIELRGQARVMPKPGAPSSGSPDMRAMDIDMAFHEGTQALQRAVLTRDATMVLVEGTGRRSISANTIVAETATDGKTLTLLDARERVEVRTPARDATPERVITAATLLATGDGKTGLTAAVFGGGVSFVEVIPAARGRAAGQRTGTSQTLNMKLKGQLDAIDEAQFQQNATFKDGDVTGDADLGIYRAAKGQLTLQPMRNGKRAPHVTTGDVTVDATELIDVDLNTKDVHARRDVKTVTAAKGGRGGGTEGALFNDREPMYGFGAEFWYASADGTARYQAPAVTPATVRQGENVVSGQAIELVNTTRDLTATGSVTSVMLLAGGGGGGRGAAPVRYRITANELVYRDKARTASYAGLPTAQVVMTGTDGVISAARMVLTLARENRTLDRLDAEGEVYLKLAQGQEAVADTLVYVAAGEQYTLRGQPVVFRAPAEKPGACSTWNGRVGYWKTGARAPEFPLAENPGGVDQRDDASCAGALKR